MTTPERKKNTVEAFVQFPVEKVWGLLTNPERIIHWNKVSDAWHTPMAENDLGAGGKFLSGMDAKDGSAGFNFCRIYEEVRIHKLITYSIYDGRNVKIDFTDHNQKTMAREDFEAESLHASEMQRKGCQAILDNFKKYVESNFDESCNELKFYNYGKYRHLSELSP